MGRHIAEAKVAVTSVGHRLSMDPAGDTSDLYEGRLQGPKGPRFLQWPVRLLWSSKRPPFQWQLYFRGHLFAKEVADGLFNSHILRSWINIHYFHLNAIDLVADGSIIAKYVLKGKIESPSVFCSTLNL